VFCDLSLRITQFSQVYICPGRKFRSDAGFLHQVRPRSRDFQLESPFPTAENWRGPKVGQIHHARWAASLYPIKHYSHPLSSAIAWVAAVSVAVLASHLGIKHFLKASLHQCASTRALGTVQYLLSTKKHLPTSCAHCCHLSAAHQLSGPLARTAQVVILWWCAVREVARSL